MKLLICILLGHKWRRVILRHRDVNMDGTELMGVDKYYPYHTCDRCKLLGNFKEGL